MPIIHQQDHHFYHRIFLFHFPLPFLRSVTRHIYCLYSESSPRDYLATSTHAMIGSLLGWGTASAAFEKPSDKSKQWTTEQDGINKLKQGEVDTPTPKDGEVLVKIRSVSLNYRDLEGMS